MISATSIPQVLAWLATFLVHSTALLGLAWLLTRPRRRASARMTERIWRVAVLGPLFTATAASLFPHAPVLGVITSRTEAAMSGVELEAIDSVADTVTPQLGWAEPGSHSPVQSDGGLHQVDFSLGDAQYGALVRETLEQVALLELLHQEERETLEQAIASGLYTLRSLESDPQLNRRLSSSPFQGEIFTAEAAQHDRYSGDDNELLARGNKTNNAREAAFGVVEQSGVQDFYPTDSLTPVSEVARDQSRNRPADMTPGDETMLFAFASSAETLPVGGTWAESIFGNTFAGKPAPISWNALSATLWLTPAMVLALALILSAMHLSWELRKRRQATEASLLARFDAARRKAGLTRPIRLSISDRLQGPITFGFLRPEVVLPLRALDDLSAAQERSMFAHELAHVVRHDPAWFAGLALLERLFFFQPLLRVARKRLMEVAEERADDRAVAWTGNPVALASCLAEIARWILEGQRQRALPIAGMASSSLGNRIERLLVPQQPREARQHWFAPAVLALLVTTAGAAPRIGTGAEPVADVDAAWMAPSLHLNDTQIVEVDSSPEPQPNTELESVAPPQPEVAELHWKSLVNNEYALLEDELDLLADEIALLESELGADATEANRRALNLLSKRLEGLMHMRQIARALVLEVTKSSTSSATPHAQRGPR